MNGFINILGAWCKQYMHGTGKEGLFANTVSAQWCWQLTITHMPTI